METTNDASSVNWTPETEVCLFYAMRGQKPIGINKHFHMLCIHKNFCRSLGRLLPSEQIWDRLRTMYNLKALDDSEPNKLKNIKQEFKLPPEILNYKKDRVAAPEESGPEERSKASKQNRKRVRESPAPQHVKRRR